MATLQRLLQHVLHSPTKDKYHILAITLPLGMDKVQHNLIPEATFVDLLVDSKVKQAVFMCSEITILKQLHQEIYKEFPIIRVSHFEFWRTRIATMYIAFRVM